MAPAPRAPQRRQVGPTGLQRADELVVARAGEEQTGRANTRSLGLGNEPIELLLGGGPGRGLDLFVGLREDVTLAGDRNDGRENVGDRQRRAVGTGQRECGRERLRRGAREVGTVHDVAEAVRSAIAPLAIAPSPAASARPAGRELGAGGSQEKDQRGRPA